MTGLIGIPCPETGPRSSQFLQALSGLRFPQGFGAIFEPGSSVARNRNQIVRRALKDNVDYVFFLDDDQVFTPDILLRLVDSAAQKLDVVSGLYTTRLHPNVPMIFDRSEPDGSVYYRKLAKDDRGLLKLPRYGGTGAGCLLVHTSVFRKIRTLLKSEGKPINWFTLGQINSEDWGDDLWFFKLCGDVGVDIHIDLDCPVGHLAEVAIWPSWIEERGWEILSVNNGFPTILPYPEFIRAEDMETDKSKPTNILLN